jgi:hypothetical protein
MSIKPDFSDKRTLEKYSSTFSLSDMEIYLFPELLYPLVIANIMSPIIWTWRDEPWFRDINRKSFNYKINRIKQFIMEHYVFNLDLETWGLTTKGKEKARFGNFIDMDILRQSNALFGYEGDKYYFDIDIRRHFGLDAYTSDVIPYWKTETIEAMTAFRYKESCLEGAGECVSFSALYVAALFIIGRIPLENIFMMGTPLHSQNFINFGDGVLTNNRRIVTKKMWFNGTSMSAKARRALENEKITIVAHISGYIHHLFDQATIQKEDYLKFEHKLKGFLSIDLTPAVFINFLRYHMNFKKCFQYRHVLNGHDYYIALETLFAYEHHSRNSFSEPTREALMGEIDDEEFSHSPLKERIIIQEVEKFLAENGDQSIDSLKEKFLNHAKESKCNQADNITQLFGELVDFLNVKPQLPHPDKQFIAVDPLKISVEMTRQEILDHISEKADDHEVALLSLYTYRQMDKIDWKPFVKAALERNPVSLENLKDRDAASVFQLISAMPDESVYDGQRLAQPDEVWNFRRGDGLEKALMFANYLYNTGQKSDLCLFVENASVILEAGGTKYYFTSAKEIVKHLKLTDQVNISWPDERKDPVGSTH